MAVHSSGIEPTTCVSAECVDLGHFVNVDLKDIIIVIISVKSRPLLDLSLQVLS